MATSHATFTIERTFKSPPERVFAAWADPAARQRWFVESDGKSRSTYTHDFRVGGQEHGSFEARPDLPPIQNTTIFLDIVTGARIVFAYTMGFGGQPFSASLATVEFAADGAGTRLTFTEQGAFFDGGDGPDMRKQGWMALLDCLAREIA